MNKRTDRELLEEILSRLQFTMAHLHLMIDEKVVTIEELYEDALQPVIIEETDPEKVNAVTDEIIQYAFKTLNFKVIGAEMVITKDNAIFKIPLAEVNKRIKHV